jgi:hypothetical protein
MYTLIYTTILSSLTKKTEKVTMGNDMSKEIKISVIRESVGRRPVACCCTKVVMVVIAWGGAQAREDIDDELAAAIAVLGLAPNNLKAWHS